MPLFMNGHNVNSDNYFTSLDLCSLVGSDGFRERGALGHLSS